MANTGHSAFPASSAYRLLACPGSYALGAQIGNNERRSTEFSAQGTLAHSVSEAALFAGVAPDTVLGRTYTADGFEFTPDEEFVEGVQTYVDFVRGLIALGYLIVLETRVSPTIHWAGLKDLGLDLFGTADCIAFHPVTGKLLIVDLKFGKGIPVEADGNPQLLYYGAGAFDHKLLNQMLTSNGHPPLPDTWAPTEVETIVIQPRAWHPKGPIRSASYTGVEVVDWSRGPLYLGVERAINDGGKTLNPGDHCRFCPALAHCPAAHKLALDTAKEAFANVPATNVPMANPRDPDPFNPPVLIPEDALVALPDTHITDKELGELLDKVAIIKPLFAALERLAEERLSTSVRPDIGWKLVPTRTKRVWQVPDHEVSQAMANEGIHAQHFTETRLKTPAQVERAIGKKKFREINAQAGLISQSKAGQTLVPAHDPRAIDNDKRRSPKEAFG